MTSYKHDTIVPFSGSAKGKKQQVAEMFDRIACRYDFLNRFLSGGIDVYWRRKAIQELSALHPKTILDVATGTADVAILLNKLLTPEKITGIDISEGMLELGKKKIEKLGLTDKIFLETGDCEQLHFPDHSFDAVTVAFGVRNFENLEKGLKEMLRVLKPGGKLVILEFSQPKKILFRKLYSVYLRIVAPGIASIISKNRAAYAYLNESVFAFPEGDQFLEVLNRSGYSHTSLKSLSFGICTIYTGSK